MKLDIVQYFQDKNLSSQWQIQGCQLGNINLIVGKNATGKSKIINSINSLGSLLFGNEIIRPSHKFREWEVIFDSDKSIKKYTLIIENGQVTKEEFTINSKTYLSRGQSGEGTIWAEELEKNIKFQTPSGEVAAVKRRDSIQHPFFEDLYTWASSLRYYQFGTALGKNSMARFPEGKDIRELTDFKDADFVIGIFKIGQEDLGQQFIDAIKTDMKAIGYNISEIGLQKPSNLFNEKDQVPFFLEESQYLYVKENDLNSKTEQIDMSQGMFRALSLIIQINYSLLASKPSCILIDDIGEGLDYERSSAMIKVLIEKAKTGLVQLIMTTNDRFIMNGVPLEYWSVIERKPGVAKIHNIENSKNIFDEFKFTGLNNFDFFATNFYTEGFAE